GEEDAGEEGGSCQGREQEGSCQDHPREEVGLGPEKPVPRHDARRSGADFGTGSAITAAGAGPWSVSSQPQASQMPSWWSATYSVQGSNVTVVSMAASNHPGVTVIGRAGSRRRS